jgi:hypothetical protein|uniref:Uncharacterized protein n=1 Tax=viral metagenome TaxID=1070528 RepID=A0A6C0H0B5_9ZZZZ
MNYQKKIQKINIERINKDHDIKCHNKNCVKLASYIFNNTYYCWFHRIDLNIKNNFSL